MKYIILMLSVTFITLTESAKSQLPAAKFKKEFLERINSTRKKGCTCGVTYMPPAPPLVWNDELAKAALGHAQDMNEHNYFSHESKDGRTELNRVEGMGYARTGYKSYAIGENIAQGQQSIAEVMDGWFKSEGHCMNLMNPAFKEVGVAEYDTYWVQDFGGRETFSPEMQRMIKSGKVRIIQQSGSVQ
jgi:uncharacterized protein YkwD